MIALTRSGFEKYIRGTINLANDTKIAILQERNDTLYTTTESQRRSSNFTKANVDMWHLGANPNTPLFPISDFSSTYDPTSNKITIAGQLTIGTLDFNSVGIWKMAAVIDTRDNEPVGIIYIYPTNVPITYNALNSNPVNIDYRPTGIANLQFKTSYNTAQRISFSSTTFKNNYADTFPNSILKLPIYDSTTTTNLSADLRIALLSTDDSFTGDETVFRQTIFADSKVLSTLDSMDNYEGGTRYVYLTGGFKFKDLVVPSTIYNTVDMIYPTMSANDTTLYMPGVTINESKVFAVVYFEEASARGLDVMSDNYKKNSYILTTIQDVHATQMRFPFRQSVIIDPNTNDSVTNSNYAAAGIFSMASVIGPGIANNNLENIFQIDL